MEEVAEFECLQEGKQLQAAPKAKTTIPRQAGKQHKILMQELKTPMLDQPGNKQKDKHSMAEWREFKNVLMEIRDDARMLYSILTDYIPLIFPNSFTSIRKI